MKLHSLHVRNFRGIRDERIEFGDTITIISGRNEVGKSSLIDAFDYLITHKSTSSRKEVKQAQPIGKDIGPEVEADFTIGADRVTYRKRWRVSNETVLTFTAGPKSGQSYTGGEAHDLAEQLWSGLDKTLWDASRLMQATALDTTALSGSTALQRALDSQAGSVIDDGTSAPLMARISAEADKYYTATRNENQEVKKARARAEKADDDLVDAQKQADGIKGLIEELVRLEDSIAKRATTLASAEQDLAELDKKAALAQAAQADLDKAEQARQLSQRDVVDAQAALESRQALINQMDEATTELEQLTAQHKELSDALTPKNEAITDVQAKLEKARQEQRAVRKQLDQARMFERQARTKDEVKKLTALLADYDSLSEQIATLDARLVQVDSALVSQATTLQRDLEVARLAAQAGAAKVTIDLLGDDKDITVDGEQTRLTSEPLTRAVLADLHIELPGHLSITVSPDSNSGDRARERQQQEEQLSALLTETCFDTVDALASALADFEEGTRELTRLKERRSDRLNGAPVSDIRDELASKEAWLAQQEEAVEGDIEQLEEAEQNLSIEVDTAQAILEEKEKEAGTIRSRLEQLSGQVSLQGDAVTKARKALDKAREKVADAALKDALDTAETEKKTHEDACDSARQKLEDAGGSSLLSDHENMRDRVEGLRKMLDRDRNTLRVTRGVLEDRDREGIEIRLNEAETEKEHASRELASLLTRAEAAKLLESVMKKHQEETHRKYIAPFRDALEALGRRTYHNDTFSVEVSSDLEVTGRHMNGTLVSFEDLSTGAKEQMSILIRLATATLVSEEDAVPIMFDDTLGYTDQTRLDRIVNVMGSSDTAGQIIIFTANEDRFATLNDAHHVQL